MSNSNSKYSMKKNECIHFRSSSNVRRILDIERVQRPITRCDEPSNFCSMRTLSNHSRTRNLTMFDDRLHGSTNKFTENNQIWYKVLRFIAPCNLSFSCSTYISPVAAEYSSPIEAFRLRFYNTYIYDMTIHIGFNDEQWPVAVVVCTTY